MKKRILVKGPALSLSGYGEQARFALRSLREHEDKFEIFLQNIPWGKTGHIINDSEEFRWLQFLNIKTQQYLQNKGNFDISIQVTIPNEFEKIAPVNVGYTAGIETTKVSPHWLDKARMMDKIIVVSNHSKQVFDVTEYKLKNEQTGEIIDFKNTTPIEVVHFPAKKLEKKEINLDLKTDFNFLSVAQWGPRKNVEATIVAFLKEFKNQSDVGLVLKLNMAKNSIADKLACENKLQALKKTVPDAKCKIYLLHGNMTEEELNSLYVHPKIKAIVSTTHGEGFGLPLFEAVCVGLPVIAPKWSGHVDFLLAPVKEDGRERMRNHFTTVDFELANVNKEAVWDGVIQADSQWCFVKEFSVMDAMKKVYKNHSASLATARKLKEYILQEFSEQKQKEKFVSLFLEKSSDTIDNLVKFVDIQENKEGTNSLKKISFCISTNGKKVEKTKKSISSIKNTMNSVSQLEYEILLCGNIEPFKDVSSVVLIEENEMAQNGKLASLRNICTNESTGDVLVFLDDDIVFEKNWCSRLLEYTKNNKWNILGNKILLPNGDRYWDRATIQPHQMVAYDFDETNKKLYQTGCFWIVRREVYEKHKWDSNIGYYAERTGGINEDVEYSMRLISNGYVLKFDKENTVWHWDDSYRQFNIGENIAICVKENLIPQNVKKEFKYLEQFNNLLETI